MTPRPPRRRPGGPGRLPALAALAALAVACGPAEQDAPAPRTLQAASTCAPGDQRWQEPITDSLDWRIDYGIKNQYLSGVQSSCYGTTLSNLHHAGEDLAPVTSTRADIFAVGPGEVVYAQDQNYPGDVIVIRHQLHEAERAALGMAGSEVYSQYGHVTDMQVRVGDMVTRGQQLATLHPQGSNTHLHWEMRTFETTSLCASSGTRTDGPGYTGPSTHPDTKGYMHPGDAIATLRAIVPDGDGGCTSPCAVRADEPLTLDQTQGACLTRRTEWWTEMSGGFDGTYLYTEAIATAQPDTTGTWHVQVEEAGDYTVSVHLPAEGDPSKRTRMGRYEVSVDGASTDTFDLDQSAQTGWVELGTMRWPQGARVDITQPDNTGEPYASGSPNNRRIIFDALRVELAQPPIEDPPEDDDPPIENDPPVEDEPPVENDPPTEDDDDPLPAPDPGDDGGEEDPSSPEPGPGEQEDSMAEQGGGDVTISSSSSCAHTPGAPRPSGWGALVGLLAACLGWRRRRRL